MHSTAAFRYPRVLSIAGSDSGGGAGIQADLKTIAALGCFGMTAITALTAQNTLGVRSIHAVPLQILADQIDAVVEDIGVDAVKIGMLHSADTVRTVAAALQRHGLTRVVLDPVMIATSGAKLIDDAAIDVLVRELFPLATVVTPNLDEAALLVGQPLATEADMEAAARQLIERGAHAVLVKGGHLAGDTVSDLLLARGAAPLWMRDARIASPNTHGTGCTLSSAIASELALGADLPQAVQRARDFVRGAQAAGAQRAHRRRQRPAEPRLRAAGHAPAAARMNHALVDPLLAFLAQEGCSDGEFEAMALRLFAQQHAHNAAFRRFCQLRGATPRTVKGWRDIPAVPISAFKEVTLSCTPPEQAERVFMTSGTTRGDVKGRHYHPTIAVWDASFKPNFARRFMQGTPRLPMAILFPSEQELPNSSLAHYLAMAVREFGTADSAYFVNLQGMDHEGLRRFLRRAQASGEPCAVLGASYSFVHFLDAPGEEGFALPAGSRILDTGGYKGQARELSLENFYARLSAAFGVPRERCINMYGMTELSTQFYDDGNAHVPSVKSGPHWLRSRIVDPLTGRDVPSGERGVLVHCDLASFNSVTTILTEDVGVAVDGGFLLLGRAEGAQARGCSLAMQEFLQAARP